MKKKLFLLAILTISGSIVTATETNSHIVAGCMNSPMPQSGVNVALFLESETKRIDNVVIFGGDAIQKIENCDAQAKSINHALKVLQSE